MVDQAKQLSAMRAAGLLDQRELLRELWHVCHRLIVGMPEGMVSRLLYFERRDPVPRGSAGKRKRGRGRSGSIDVGLGEASKTRIST